MSDIKKITAADPESHSADQVAQNLDQLKALFPEAFTEGKVDFDVLKQLLGAAIDDRDEKYGLNWHGKRRARQLALTSSTGTLRPCPEESVEWDTSQNLMIEGDNLEVLKLLQKSYTGKVKLIYIDPPYNTGKDFVYADDYQDNIKNYLELTGQIQSGRRISSNTDASGRFHTDWLNMIHPRLKLARNLLRQDGILLVSIDEREFANLRHMLVEIFGEENAIATIVWKGATDNNPTQIAVEHEYMLCFARSKESADGIWKNSTDTAKGILLEEFRRLRRDDKLSIAEVQKQLRNFIKANRESLSAITHYDRVDEKGVYTGSRKVHNPKPGGYKYDVVHPVTKKVCVPPVNGYRYPKETMDGLIAENRILYGDDETQIIQIKEYLEDYEGKLSSVIHLDSRAGANELNDLFAVQKLFSNPKPVTLLKDVFEFVLKDEDLALDFFAGSGTTGHAVGQLNVQDNGRRKWILVQLPEPLDPADKDQKVAAKYCDSLGKPRTLAELTKERLRRASIAMRKSAPEFSGDLGFRVFKLDSTNIHEWAPRERELGASLQTSIDHLKTGRKQQDILYELLLKLGLDLCVPVEKKTIAKTEVYAVGGGVLIASLAEEIETRQVETLALGIVEWHKALAPAGEVTCVFRDSAFENDVAKTNMAAILEQHGLKNVRSL